jgi:hypothetical protein
MVFMCLRGVVLMPLSGPRSKFLTEELSGEDLARVIGEDGAALVRRILQSGKRPDGYWVVVIIDGRCKVFSRKAGVMWEEHR